MSSVQNTFSPFSMDLDDGQTYDQGSSSTNPVETNMQNIGRTVTPAPEIPINAALVALQRRTQRERSLINIRRERPHSSSPLRSTSVSPEPENLASPESENKQPQLRPISPNKKTEYTITGLPIRKASDFTFWGRK